MPSDEIQGYNIYVDGELRTQIKGNKKTNVVVEDIKPTEVGICTFDKIHGNRHTSIDLFYTLLH